jgi:chromosome partitioning protein
MPVIPIAIPKGGAGKTTTALVVALELADLGKTVTIIDGDQNGHIVGWTMLPGVPPNITVLSAKLDTMIDQVKAAAVRSRFVIVDLEGTANPMVSLAVSLADLVIIPIQASHLDAKEAAHMIRLIRHQESVTKRTIPYAILLTRTNPAIIPGSQKQVERTLTERAIPTFQTQLYDREAYRALFCYGGHAPRSQTEGRSQYRGRAEQCTGFGSRNPRTSRAWTAAIRQACAQAAARPAAHGHPKRAG